MRKITKCLAIICLAIGMLPMCAACTNHTTHGFDKYFHLNNEGILYQMGTSSVEIDQFGDIYPLYTDYSYIDGDYHYHLEEGLPFYDILEYAIVYFTYEENDYQNAKVYCQENLPTLGDTVAEEYNGYLFYDIYGNRSKDDFYHGDNYPKAFKRVAFHEEKNVILFLGFYATDKRAQEAEQDLQDWGNFLQKYFSEFYSFDA